MKNVLIQTDFFGRSTLRVAQELLGKVLVRRLSSGVYRYRIVETEAYCGEKDLACHANKGRTKRTEIMFGPAGYIYVYLIYGMYYCLNFVTSQEGEGEAVLIRAVEPLFETSKKTDGPGKLCRVLRIDTKLNQQKLGRPVGLWIENDSSFIVQSSDVGSSPRRGVAYAKHCAHFPWRFFIKSSKPILTK